MSYTHTLSLKDPPNLTANLKDQGLGVMISLRMSIGSTTILNRGYSPFTLFLNGEPGVWFDPSDVANLNWRRNLLTRTEEFDNAAWLKFNASATANALVAPNGTTTADTFTISSTFGGAYQVTTLPIGTVTASAYFRASTANANVALGITDNSVDYVLRFNVTTGAFVSASAGLSTYSITSVGDGWYRATATRTLAAANPNVFVSIPAGTSGNAFSVWGAQLELGSVATDYQRITDVNTEVIERFPTATLYQDTAGTTPVTTTGQSVGLMLDKSKGLVLGSELVTNGDFSGGTTGWTAANSATIAVTSGVAQVTQTSSNLAAIRQSVTTVVGRSYRVSCAIASQNGAGIVAIAQDTGTFAVIGQSAVVSSTDQTTVTLTFVATATTTFVAARFNASGASGNTFTVDNISVKELPGNHAVQATTANRPIYGIHPVGGRRNLLERTEDFTVSPWAATALGASTRTNTTSPYSFGLGLVTVTSANGGIRQQKTGLISGQPYTLSFYLESATPNINVVFENGAANFGALHVVSIDPSTGVFSGVSGFTSTSSVVFGTGRIYTIVSAPAGGSLIANIEWRVTAASGSFLLGRPQFEASATATAYQRVTDQYNVTEAGVSSVSYLFFDGVNDSLATPTITPGVDKAQVFAGVRKLSDANFGMIAETGATTDTTPGSVGIFGRNQPGYTFASYGSLRAAASVSSGYASPTTNALTGLSDIAGDLATMRINGTQVAQSTGDQGTGNFLAHPLYIGARAGTSLFFSGHLYSLIARFGPNLDTGQISSTETWVAGKTGITI
jgi:hypothetical protein